MVGPLSNRVFWWGVPQGTGSPAGVPTSAPDKENPRSAAFSTPFPSNIDPSPREGYHMNMAAQRDSASTGDEALRYKSDCESPASEKGTDLFTLKKRFHVSNLNCSCCNGSLFPLLVYWSRAFGLSSG